MKFPSFWKTAEIVDSYINFLTFSRSAVFVTAVSGQPECIVDRCEMTLSDGALGIHRVP